MSEFDYDPDLDDDQPETEPRQNPVRARMKQLEKENAEKDKALAEALQAKRELAFLKAGVNPDAPAAKYFIKAYDGDLTPDAIRMAATEAQLIAPQPPVDDSDKQAWRETNRIAAGAETAPEPGSWVKRIQDAKTSAELDSIFAEARAQGIDFGS